MGLVLVRGRVAVGVLGRGGGRQVCWRRYNGGDVMCTVEANTRERGEKGGG